MSEIRDLSKEWREAEAALADVRNRLGAKLLEQLEAGVPQKDLVDEMGVGTNRETVRLMIKKAREAAPKTG